MEKPNLSSHSSQEFRDWNDAKTLVITPKFQRREVWRTPARSYFIESLLQDIPIPPIFLRIRQDKKLKRVVREVIDGQQRLRALLGFMGNEYALSKTVNDYGGKKFSELPEEVRQKIEKFVFLCEVFQQISDEEVLEVFARVNTYSVGLNDQELRNGTYFGHFKRSAYRIAHQHLEFWRAHAIFSESGIARMLEVELTSELMIAMLAGQQDKKKSIDSFYRDFDESFPKRKTVETRFAVVADCINTTMDDDLRDTEFRRVPLFYTLFCVIYHRLYGLPGISNPSPKKHAMSGLESTSLKDDVLELSKILVRSKEDPDVPARFQKFVQACSRQTDNLKPRLTRFRQLYTSAF
jgi:hypothetical protein